MNLATLCLQGYDEVSQNYQQQKQLLLHPKHRCLGSGYRLRSCTDVFLSCALPCLGMRQQRLACHSYVQFLIGFAPGLQQKHLLI